MAEIYAEVMTPTLRPHSLEANAFSVYCRAIISAQSLQISHVRRFLYGVLAAGTHYLD